MDTLAQALEAARRVTHISTLPVPAVPREECERAAMLYVLAKRFPWLTASARGIVADELMDALVTAI